jgi:hypothetical protein
MVPLVERPSVAHDALMLTRRTNVFFALLGPERTAIGLVRIRQGSGLVEQFDDASRTWRAVPDARFAEALAQRRLDPTRGVALARARGVLQGS